MSRHTGGMLRVRNAQRSLWAVAITVFLAASPNPVAAEALRVDAESEQWNLALHADYLEETDRELAIEEVAHPDMASAFKPLGANSVSFGVKQGACWFRFTIVNTRQEAATFYVEIDNPRIKQADFHMPGRDTPEAHQRAGTFVPFNERPMPYRNGVFRLTLEPGQEQTVYLRAYHRGSYRFDLLLWDTEAFVQHRIFRRGMGGMFYGALIVMLAFNLVLFVLFRDGGYLLLTLLIACAALFFVAYQRVDAHYLWPDRPDLPGSRVNLFFGLGCCAGLFFSRGFLQTAKYAPRWDKVFLFYAGLSILVGADLVVKNTWADWLLQFLGGTVPIVFVVGAVLCIRHGNRYAWGYLIAWGGLFLAMIPFTLLGSGLIPVSPLAEHSVKFAFPIALALTSIALWQRFREIQEKHSKNLDRQVKERTKELTEALENVKTLCGLIPICSSCKSIRDDQGFWTRVETYIQDHSDADITHSICPNCAKKLYNFTGEEDSS